MSRNKLNIVLTGGHARSTAYAVIGEIRRRKKKWKLFFIGSKKAIEGTEIPTLEAEVFPELGVKFIPIFTGRLQRKFTIWTIPSLVKIPFGFIHALYLLLKLKPNIIISFGGFSAFPVVIVGWILRITIIVHEQTAVIGRTNKYSSYFATKIAVSRHTSEKYFPKGKTTITGNPVSAGVLTIKQKKHISKPPIVFITGGQTGSVSINNIISELLNKLLEKYQIIHQVGRFQYDKFNGIRSNLPVKLKERYSVYSVVNPRLWHKYLKEADVIVSRAGANIVSEILVAKRPSILIPLPLAYLDEQMENAKYAKNYGVAEIIEQDMLTGEKLNMKIDYIIDNWSRICKRVLKKKSPDIKASKTFVDLMEEFVK